MTREDAALASEARVFSRYLVSRDASPAIVERYRRAVARRLPDVAPDLVVKTARAVPILIGPLDAGAALVRTDHQLRHRLLLLTAVLEASPEHCDEFLPRPFAKLEAVRTVLAVGFGAVVDAVVGVPLFVLLASVTRRHV